MNRTDFQELAEIRLKDAEALLKAGRFEGAYYLCGYVIECALKACIAKNVDQYDFPPEPKVVQNLSYTHDLGSLVKGARLEADLDAEASKNAAFLRNWTIVRNWKESSRYEKPVQQHAEGLFSAVTDGVNGVLPWIRLRW